MKIPPGLLDPRGQIAKGQVHLEANGDDVQEYGLTVTGKHSTCYVLVSPGDIITAHFAINSGVAGEFADLVVDGVLRNSWANSKGKKIFRYIFDRAVYSGIQPGEARKSTKHCRMKVQERDFTKDLPMNGNRRASNVGSIRIQIYRKEITDNATTLEEAAKASENGLTQHGSGSGNGSGDATAEPASGVIQHGSGSGNGSGDVSGGDATTADTNTTPASPDLGVCQREPDYFKCLTWQDLNRHIDSNIIAPAFEIGFSEGNKSCAKPKERIKHVYTGDYKLWVSFTFLLRSTADLRAHGFDNVPLHYSPNASSMRAFPTITGPFQGGEAGDSVDALFVDDAGGVSAAVEVVVKTKKDPAKKESKKDVGKHPTEPSTDASVLDYSAEKLKKDKATIAKSSVDVEKTKGELEAESKNDETREDYIARKKVEVVLPSLDSGLAHQAYLQQPANEQPEGDDNDMEATSGTPSRSGMSDILAHGVQSGPGNRESCSERLPTHIRRSSSPPAPGLASSPSNNREVMIDTHPILSTPVSLYIPTFPAYNLDERRPSLPVIALSKPSSTRNRGITEYSVPDFSRPPTSNSELLPPREGYARCNSISCMASHSRPSTPTTGDILNYSMPGLSTSTHPGLHGFSATTPDGLQSTRPGVPSLGESVTSHPISRSSLVNSYSPGGVFEGNALSSFTALIPPQTSHHPPEAVMVPGYQSETGNSYFGGTTPTTMTKKESLRITRASTPEPMDTETELPNQPQPEDTNMLRISHPPSPAPLKTPLQDTQLLPETRSSSPISSEIPTEVSTEGTDSQVLGTTVAPSQTPTEAATNDALKTIRLSSQRDASSHENDQSTSQATTTQSLKIITPHQSFNNTEQSHILGVSQQLLDGPEVEPLTPPATLERLPWQNREPVNERLSKDQDVYSPIQVQQEGSVNHHPVPASFLLDSAALRQPKPAAQAAQASLTSPPFCGQKRKVESITGADFNSTMQPHKIPNSQGIVEREQHQREIEKLERECTTLTAPDAKADQQLKEVMACYEEQELQLAIARGMTPATEQPSRQRNEGEPRWEEEIMQQNQVARARMAAAEQQRKELQVRYEAALAVQKEKVNELNKEAEKMERENTELQARIVVLFRAESI